MIAADGFGICARAWMVSGALAKFLVCLVLILSIRAGAESTAPAGSAEVRPFAGVVVVPAGIHRPVLRGPTEPREIPVGSFGLDAMPVTNEDYLAFVKANPRWRRSTVKRLFADGNYLRPWADDLEPGTNAAPRQPVTWISWFAAKSYASWKGGRLPTTAEWEYAASAGRNSPSITNDPAYRREIVRWYGLPSPARLPEVGAGAANFHRIHDLHGLVWEWTSDFNSALVTGDARGDTGMDRQLFCGAGALEASGRDDFPAYLRYGFRSSLKAAYTVHNLGFRCAYDATRPVVSAEGAVSPSSSPPLPNSHAGTIAAPTGTPVGTARPGRIVP